MAKAFSVRRRHPPQYTQVLWDLNLVSFALAIGAAGLTLGGLGLAVLTSGTSIGLGRRGVVGAVFLLAGSVQSQAVLQGSPAVPRRDSVTGHGYNGVTLRRLG